MLRPFGTFSAASPMLSTVTWGWDASSAIASVSALAEARRSSHAMTARFVTDSTSYDLGTIITGLPLCCAMASGCTKR